MDARLYQIAFLAVLLTTGVLLRDFSLRPEQMALTFAAGLAMQWLCIRILGLKRVGYLSAAITCLGLSILLRADTLWVHPLAATIAIGATPMAKASVTNHARTGRRSLIGRLCLRKIIIPGRRGRFNLSSPVYARSGGLHAARNGNCLRAEPTNF
jgi:hypothetical protein